MKELFKVLRKLRTQGMGIVFVTHFLDQVYAISDRITVLRDGRLVGEYETAKLPKVELVSRMIGKNITQLESARRSAVDADHEPETLVELRKLGREGSIAPMDMTIGKGEIVGLAGLLGSGRTETARLIFGIDKPQTGEMLVEGRKVVFHSPRQAIREGFAFTPENRKVEGIVPHLWVRENIILALQARQGTTNTLSQKRQEEIAEEFIKVLGIRIPDPSRRS